MQSTPSSLRKIYIEPVQGACNRRQLDAEKIASFFVSNGFYLVSNPKEAEVIFLITCAVSTKRENSSLRRIEYLKKFPGQLIVGGCLPAINGMKLQQVFSGTSIPTSELFKIDDCLPERKVKFSDLDDANHYFPFYSGIFSYEFAEIAWHKLLSLRRCSLKYIFKKEILRIFGMLTKKTSRQMVPYPVRISWGCNQKCSYCGIRTAVGKFRSKPMEVCRDEFLRGVSKGYTEFEIIADDVGAYGIDIGKKFPDLLNELLSIPGDYHVLIWNLSPVWLVHNQDNFLQILEKQKINRIHFPAQSGSCSLLKAMNRYSDVVKTTETLLLCKKHSPGLILTTDLIVGFPGETDEDIEATIEFVRAVRFHGVNLFMYYSVPNTLAHGLENQVPQKVIEKRVRKISEAFDKLEIEYTIT